MGEGVGLGVCVLFKRKKSFYKVEMKQYTQKSM